MSKEIGSEFYYMPADGQRPLYEYLKNLSGDSVHFSGSGRTALDVIIKDICSERRFKEVHLPSYCCETMIIPFVDNEIKVSFYDVSFGAKGVKVSGNKIRDTDAIVVMNYFGFQSNSVETFIDDLNTQNIIIIKDVTQSLFIETIYDERVDYMFASLRKWMGIPDGALLAKGEGMFNAPLPKNENTAYIDLRLEAMRQKEAYFAQNKGSKEAYLAKFAEASHALNQDYAGYRMSDQSVEILETLDVDVIKARRQQNAGILISALKHVKEITLPFTVIEEDDVPLFVPILVTGGLRDALSKHLISKQIYCPVHWPLSTLHKLSETNKEVYHQELSLVCDQRYNIEDMQRIVDEISIFFKHNTH